MVKVRKCVIQNKIKIHLIFDVDIKIGPYKYNYGGCLFQLIKNSHEIMIPEKILITGIFKKYI